jgi:hypothetical protein
MHRSDEGDRNLVDFVQDLVKFPIIMATKSQMEEMDWLGNGLVEQDLSMLLRRFRFTDPLAKALCRPSI